MPNSQKKTEVVKSTETKETKPKICGVVRPISSIDGCSEAHWDEVHNIIERAAHAAGFSSKLVSDAAESGLIHNHIVKNLYNNEIVVCVLSGKNTNVMFELGMRLAFNKPTVIIVDDKTEYSFDTSVIEHIVYPRGLYFHAIEKFIDLLTKKIKDTYNASLQKDYISFLDTFGNIPTPEIKNQHLTSEQLLRNDIQQIKTLIRNLINAKLYSSPSFENLTSSLPALAAKHLTRKGEIDNGYIAEKIQEFCYKHILHAKDISKIQAAEYEELIDFLYNDPLIQISTTDKDSLRFRIPYVIDKM